MKANRNGCGAAFCLLFLASSSPAFAEVNAGSQRSQLVIELNKTSQAEAGCQLSFVAVNNLDSDLTQLGFEMAFFGKDGGLQRMSVLDFRDLPKGRTKIRQFVLPDTECSDLGRVLINEVAVCESSGSVDCDESLTLSSRLSVKLGR